MAKAKSKFAVLMFCPEFRSGPVLTGINAGAERQAETLAIALVKAGCQITILTPRLDPDSPAIEESSGVMIERFPYKDLSRRYPVPGIALLNVPFILWQIVRAVRPRLKGMDLLHCHIGCLQTAGAALAAHMAKVPVLCKAAMADRRSDLGEIEKTGASGRLVACLARILIKTWVATTGAVAQALIRAGVEPGNIVSIPNGVDQPEQYNKRRTCKVRRFLYVGRLSTNIQRDVPTLIRAFDRIAASEKQLELAIVGGGDLLEQTRKLVQTCATRERIHLPGFDRPEKWLSWADCFVLPSRREGLSNALLEAMAAGLPCIANDIPPNREVLDGGHAGVLVPVEDCSALEVALTAMIRDDAMARRFGRSARSRAECYSIKSVAARYVSLYESLVCATAASAR